MGEFADTLGKYLDLYVQWFGLTHMYIPHQAPPPPSIHSIFSIVFCILCLLQEVVSALSFLVILCLTQVTGERSEVTHDINERVARYSLFARGVTALLSALRGGGVWEKSTWQ